MQIKQKMLTFAYFSAVIFLMLHPSVKKKEYNSEKGEAITGNCLTLCSE
jgi:hypothetical protein